MTNDEKEYIIHSILTLDKITKANVRTAVDDAVKAAKRERHRKAAERAKRENGSYGRPSDLTADEYAQAIDCLKRRKLSVRRTAQMLGLSRGQVQRVSRQCNEGTQHKDLV